MSHEQTRTVCAKASQPLNTPNLNASERHNALLDLLISVGGVSQSNILPAVFLPQGKNPFASLPSEKFVVFPTSAVVSAHLAMPDGASPGVSIVGYDGSFGRSGLSPKAFFQVDYRTVQAGFALPVSASSIRQVFNEPLAGRELHNYLMFTIQMVATVPHCVARHSAESRVARWIVSVYERSPMKNITATHEFIGDYLSMRRESVTESLGNLTASGAIQMGRGSITVVSPTIILEKCCVCRDLDRFWLQHCASAFSG